MSVAHKLVKFGNISRGTNSNKKQNVTNVTQFWSILVALQQRSYKVFVICRGCLGGGLVAQLLFT